MSSKIDIRKIISNHINSMVYVNGKRNIYDFVTFFVFPIVCAIFFCVRNWKLTNDVIGIFINLGSIFTALLLSVLVMIYDQYQKITNEMKQMKNSSDRVYQDKLSRTKDLIKELFANISYAVIVSVILVFSALSYQILGSEHFFSKWVFMPLCVFLVGNLLLTVLMIIKRTYNLISNG